jgi:hypothetical protein
VIDRKKIKNKNPAPESFAESSKSRSNRVSRIISHGSRLYLIDRLLAGVRASSFSRSELQPVISPNDLG